MKWLIKYYVQDVIVEAEDRDTAIDQAAQEDREIEFDSCEEYNEPEYKDEPVLFSLVCSKAILIARKEIEELRNKIKDLKKLQKEYLKKEQDNL